MKIAMKPAHLKEFAAHLSQIAVLREEEKTLFKSTSQVSGALHIVISLGVDFCVLNTPLCLSLAFSILHLRALECSCQANCTGPSQH